MDSNPTPRAYLVGLYDTIKSKKNKVILEQRV